MVRTESGRVQLALNAVKIPATLEALPRPLGTFSKGMESESCVGFNFKGREGVRGSPREPSSPQRPVRRSVTPYSGAMSTRPRRSRPEPYQLDALKVLFTRTATPTIEERSALALEIGM